VSVKQWSVPIDSIQNWMLGPVRSQPTLTFDNLDNAGQDIPWLPGSRPTQDLDNDKPAVDKFVAEADEQHERIAQAMEAETKRAEKEAEKPAEKEAEKPAEKEAVKK
jgi:hypothetical protein